MISRDYYTLSKCCIAVKYLIICGAPLSEVRIILVATVVVTDARCLINVYYYLFMYFFVQPKVYLHEQNDIAMIKDLGFAVSPGVHALLAAKYSTVSTGKQAETLQSLAILIVCHS